MKNSRATKVFLEYGHGSEDHQDAVLQLAWRLRERGVDASLDQFEESPPEGWPQWMKNQVVDSDYVLVICSPELKKKLESASMAQGKGAKFESQFTLSALYDSVGHNDKFIPVLLSDGDGDNVIPHELRPYTHYVVSDQNRFDRLYARLTNQTLVVKPPLGTVVEISDGNPEGRRRLPDAAVEELPKKTRVSEFEPEEFLASIPIRGVGLSCKKVNIDCGSLVGEANCGFRIHEWQGRSFRAGHRIRIEFFYLPNGIRVGVPNRINHPNNKGQEALRRVEGADARGANGRRTQISVGLAEVPTGEGRGAVVFEFTRDSGVTSIEIPIVVGWDGTASGDDKVGIGCLQASASLAPIAGSFPPGPGEYAMTGSRDTIFSIIRCSTALLFPSIEVSESSRVRLAITNASIDFYGSPERFGGVDIYFVSASGAISAVMAGTLLAGESFIYDIYHGSPERGVEPIREFAGYVYVDCEFGPARGIAFITRRNNDGLTESYCYHGLVSEKNHQGQPIQWPKEHREED